MKGDVIDTYQLTSLIELTNTMVDESINSKHTIEGIIKKFTNKLVWTLNFDLCFKLDSSNGGLLEYIYNGNDYEDDFSCLKQQSLSYFKQNKEIYENDNPPKHLLPTPLTPLECGPLSCINL